MNEILTLSVSRLFKETLNTSRLKTEDVADVQDKKPNLEPIVAEEEAKMIPNSMTLNHWITVEGPRRLTESLGKLRLTRDQCSNEDFSSYSNDELNSEKRNVKNELKHYDSAFIQLFQKQPARSEKEPM